MSGFKSDLKPAMKHELKTALPSYFPTADPVFAQEVAEFDRVLNDYHNIHAIVRFFNEHNVPAIRGRTPKQTYELLGFVEKSVEDLGEKYRLASRELRREVHPRAFARDEAAKRMLPVVERGRWWFAQWMRAVKDVERREELRESRLLGAED